MVHPLVLLCEEGVGTLFKIRLKIGKINWDKNEILNFESALYIK